MSVFGRLPTRVASVSPCVSLLCCTDGPPTGVEAPVASNPRSQLQGSYTDAEIPRSSRRRTRPREVLVVLVESLRLVEDSASEKERERRRGVQQGVYEGVGGAEKGIGEEIGVDVPLQALL